MRWLAAVLLVIGTLSYARGDVATPRLLLRDDQIEATVTVEYQMAPLTRGYPVSFAPDVWFGATERLTVGVIHSNASIDRIAPGSSLCFRETNATCHRTYFNAGLDARYLARTGALSVLPRARFLIRDVDPWKPALTLGALGRWQRGRIALTGDPYLRLGIVNRDKGNRAALVLPIAFSVSPIDRVTLWVQTGIDSDLAVWRDGWHIPIGLGTRVGVTSQVELGVSGGWTSALGPQDTQKRRVLFFTLGLRT